MASNTTSHRLLYNYFFAGRSDGATGRRGGACTLLLGSLVNVRVSGKLGFGAVGRVGLLLIE